MARTQIAAPYPIFTDTDGTPLDDGYLYIGEVNKNPETNPIAVYWDKDLQFPAAQPIRTNNGYPWRMGTPGMLYSNSGFSISIRNKKKDLVVYAPLGFGLNALGQHQLSGNGTQTNFTLPIPITYASVVDIYINGVYQNKTTYTASGTALVFSEAPPYGSVIELNYV